MRSGTTRCGCSKAWVSEEQGAEAAGRFGSLADRARDSFNRRFWNAETGWLFDVVDGDASNNHPGDDPACRPNQLFAISLTHPVLDRARWQAVLDAARTRLLTPVGLRSLAPGSPDYKPRYDGDLRSRDAAYHQGTVWGWLIGPFIDAWLKVYPDRLRRSARIPGWLRAAPQRGVHRLDQRSVRRGRAAHAARLHRAGLERGRSAALPGPAEPGPGWVTNSVVTRIPAAALDLSQATG